MSYINAIYYFTLVDHSGVKTLAFLLYLLQKNMEVSSNIVLGADVFQTFAFRPPPWKNSCMRPWLYSVYARAYYHLY